MNKSEISHLHFTHTYILLIQKSAVWGFSHRLLQEQVFLTAEDTQKMLDAFQNEEVGPIVFVTLYYGLRKSEAPGLRRQAVDFEKDTISIKILVRF